MNKETYKSYAQIMIRNGCRPISYYRLESHVENNCDTHHSYKTAWLVGNTEDGIFYPSHGGYSSLRDMIKLLDQLLDSRGKVVISAFKKMGDMIERRGWIFAGTYSVNYPKVQDKQFYVNHINMIPDWHW